MRRSLCLAALLFACIGSASAEPIYKWVDARGVTHFSAQPPQGSAASLVPHAKQPPAAPTPHQVARCSCSSRGWWRSRRSRSSASVWG